MTPGLDGLLYPSRGRFYMPLVREVNRVVGIELKSLCLQILEVARIGWALEEVCRVSCCHTHSVRAKNL